MQSLVKFDITVTSSFYFQKYHKARLEVDLLNKISTLVARTENEASLY